MIKQAVILAAGNGVRLQKSAPGTPKPLVKLAGVSLIKRCILTAKLAGVTDFVVVVGYQGERVISELSQDSTLGVRLQFVKNPDWKKSNGLSLLAARPVSQERFLLMMADHLFDPEAVRKMGTVSLEGSEIVLGVDRDFSGIFDEPDATKVVEKNGIIQRIGKDLEKYNAIDTGLFACSSSIFDFLQKLYQERGDFSLSEGVQTLTSHGLARTQDLTGLFWQDVDTFEALQYAERQLYKQLGKATDGWVSRNFNRKISTVVSRLLIKIGLSPIHVTGLVSLIGVLSGFFVASGSYPGVFIGGFLFNLAAILDGCDGEMARLKLCTSRKGEWLDTLSDNLAYVVFLIGVAVGAYQQNSTMLIALETCLMVAGLTLTLGLMFYYLLRYTNSGSLVSVQWDSFDEETNPNSTSNGFLRKIRFLMKRDFFALLFMILAMLNQLHLILLLAVIGTNVTWVVVLVYKRSIFNLPDREAVELNR